MIQRKTLGKLEWIIVSNEKLNSVESSTYFKFKNNLVSASLKLNFHLLQISFFVPKAIVRWNREERRLVEHK